MTVHAARRGVARRRARRREGLVPARWACLHYAIRSGAGQLVAGPAHPRRQRGTEPAWAQFWSHSLPFMTVRRRARAICLCWPGRWRTVVNAGAQYSKACEGATPPWVQIPPPPPLTCRSMLLSAARPGRWRPVVSFAGLSRGSPAVQSTRSSRRVLPGQRRAAPRLDECAHARESCAWQLTEVRADRRRAAFSASRLRHPDRVVRGRCEDLAPPAPEGPW